jgi:hypothetical protein
MSQSGYSAAALARHRIRFVAWFGLDIGHAPAILGRERFVSLSPIKAWTGAAMAYHSTCPRRPGHSVFQISRRQIAVESSILKVSNIEQTNAALSCCTVHMAMDQIPQLSDTERLCQRCETIPICIRQILDSRSGKTVRMFECKCARRSWAE